LKVPEGDIYAWDAKSTYIKSPPFFDGITKTPAAGSPIIPRRAPYGVKSAADALAISHFPAGLQQHRAGRRDVVRRDAVPSIDQTRAREYR